MECRGWQAVSMQISAQMAHLANRFRGGGNRLIINRLHIIVCICEFWRKNMLSSGYLRGIFGATPSDFSLSISPTPSEKFQICATLSHFFIHYSCYCIRSDSLVSYSICQKPTQERPFAKRFSQDIFPSSVGFGCKGSEKFAFLQILSGKSDCDKDLNKNTGSVSPIKINKNQGDTLFLL